jgi:hypothetical protein
LTKTIQDRNREIRSLYLKIKSKNRWSIDRIISMLKRIYRKRWNLSEGTIRDIVGRKYLNK